MTVLRTTSPLAFGMLLVSTFVGTPAAPAQTYTVIHKFRGAPADGAFPLAGLTGDSSGNLYGTTSSGGASNAGAVFRLNQTGLTVLYSFTSLGDGGYPYAGVIRDSAGNLYGTTQAGGTTGNGTVFKLDTTGAETVLHNFSGGTDGSKPESGLVQDPAGNLYGTTVSGGSSYDGVVFKVDTTGTETVLYSFKGQGDGINPFGGLLRDPAGNLYGTTQTGGFYYGVVFKIDTSGTETVLHRFDGGAVDGAFPVTGLIEDAGGNLYGTTVDGGLESDGVVFKLDKTGTQKVLHTFTGGADGGNPYAGLIRDSAGNLYGTTGYGGTSNLGAVFKLDATGALTVLHSFAGGADGSVPKAGLILDSHGNLYGTTSVGGYTTGACSPAGCGVVFRLSP